MGAKNRTYNIGRIRKGATYSLQEIADLYNLHIRSVREWVKVGLKIIDDHKPYLVHGSDLFDFLKQRQENKKVKCKKNQLFCCSCRAAREASHNQIIIKILNDKQLRIIANCGSCKTIINKFGATKKLESLREIFDIQAIRDQRLEDSIPPILNVHIREN